MFIDFISKYFSALVSPEIAVIFAEVIATLLALMLLFLFFSLFMDSSSRRLFLKSILIIVVVMAVFSIAKYYGFIKLPVILTN